MMPSLAEALEYDASTPMCMLEETLEDLFEAKVKGIKDTLSIEIFTAWREPSPTVSIDDSIQEFMAMIRKCKEFKDLREKDGAFMREWRGLENVLEEWNNGEMQLDRTRVREIFLEVFLRPSTKTRAVSFMVQWPLRVGGRAWFGCCSGLKLL